MAKDLPAFFDCGCSRFKVGAGLCSVYASDGSIRPGRSIKQETMACPKCGATVRMTPSDRPGVLIEVLCAGAGDCPVSSVVREMESTVIVDETVTRQ